MLKKKVVLTRNCPTAQQKLNGPPLMKKIVSNYVSINKQLLDEVEHDIMNYQNRGLCYLPKPKAEADNTDTRF